MVQVKIYSTPSCHYCKAAKQFLTEQGVAFEEIDVASNQSAAQEMIAKSGQMGVPVILVGEEIIVGFDKARLKSVIASEGPRSAAIPGA